MKKITYESKLGSENAPFLITSRGRTKKSYQYHSLCALCAKQATVQQESTYKRCVLWATDEGLPGEEVFLGDRAFISHKI